MFILLSGDQQSNGDRLLLSGDQQSNGNRLLLSENLAGTIAAQSAMSGHIGAPFDMTTWVNGNRYGRAVFGHPPVKAAKAA